MTKTQENEFAIFWGNLGATFAPGKKGNKDDILSIDKIFDDKGFFYAVYTYTKSYFFEERFLNFAVVKTMTTVTSIVTLLV